MGEQRRGKIPWEIALDAQNPHTKEVVCLVAYINDALDKSKYNCVMKVRRTNMEVYIASTRKVTAGEEWSMEYGGSYWRDPKYSVEILEKAKKCYELASVEGRRSWEEVIRQAIASRTPRETHQELAAQTNPREPAGTHPRTSASLPRKGVG